MTVLVTDQEMVEKENLDIEKTNKFILVDEEIIKLNDVISNISNIIDAKEQSVINKETEIETLLSNTINTTIESNDYLNTLNNLTLPTNTIKYRTLNISGSFNYFYPIWFLASDEFSQLIITHGRKQSNDIFDLSGSSYNEMFVKLYMKNNINDLGLFEIACKHFRGELCIGLINKFIHCWDNDWNVVPCPANQEGTKFYSGFYIRGDIDYTFGSDDESLLDTIESRINYIKNMTTPDDYIYFNENYFTYAIPSEFVPEEELNNINNTSINHLQGK
jgi:hypothetical protein